MIYFYVDHTFKIKDFPLILKTPEFTDIPRANILNLAN